MAKEITQQDSGRSWLVAAAMSFSFLTVAGFVRGFGVFYASLVEEFGGSASATSLIQGFRFAALCIAAPISSWLSERFTERLVLLVGTGVFSSALMLSYFAPNLELNVFTLGVMTGIGMALILTPAQIAIGKYFDRFQSIANSVCFCGSSLGMMTIPLIVIYLIDEYGLRGSLLIYGAFFLNCGVCAFVVRPISPREYSKSSDILKNQSPDLESSTLTKPAQELSKGVILENKCPNVVSDDLEKTTDSNIEDDFDEDSLTRYAHLQCIDGSIYLSVGALQTEPPATDEVTFSEDKVRTTKQKLCTAICDVIDFSLFRNARYVLLLLSTSMAMVSFANVTIYIIPRAEEYGITREKSALLLTIAGGCDIVGRLVLGAVSNVKKIGPHRVMMVGLVAMGVATLLLPLAKTFNTMAIYAVVFGLIGSAGHFLCLPIIVLFVGQQRMPRAMGLVVSFHGISSALSPPILGYIKDQTGTYDSTIYVCGVCQIIASVFLLLEPLARKHDERRLSS